MSYVAEALARARAREGIEQTYDRLRNANKSRFATVLAELAKGPKGTDFIVALLDEFRAGKKAYFDKLRAADKDAVTLNTAFRSMIEEAELEGIRAVLRKMGLPTDE